MACKPRGKPQSRCRASPRSVSRGGLLSAVEVSQHGTSQRWPYQAKSSPTSAAHVPFRQCSHGLFSPKHSWELKIGDAKRSSLAFKAWVKIDQNSYFCLLRQEANKGLWIVFEMTCFTEPGVLEIPYKLKLQSFSSRMQWPCRTVGSLSKCHQAEAKELE